ncbi:MAG TPA: glycogen-binding domain-containing protein [Gemmatimonadaceae bacterium]|nr:glycogen-binding domain-containing protein [Gemmatimonadaceae bacterium]
MRVTSALAGVCALSLAIAIPVEAQVFGSASVRELVQRHDTGLWQSVSRFDPAARLDGRWAQLSADASLLGSGNALRLEQGSFDAVASPAPVGPFRFTSEGSFDRVRLDAATTRSVVRLRSSASYRVGARGAWIGVGAEKALELDSSVAHPMLLAGIWQRLGGVMLSISTESHSARFGGRPAVLHRFLVSDSTWDTLAHAWTPITQTVVRGDSGSPSRALRWTDVTARADWTMDRLSLDARAGLQPKLDVAPATPWLRATATIGLSARLSLVATGGTDPSRTWLGMPASRFASLGFRVAAPALVRPAAEATVRPSVAAFSVRRTDADSYLITMRVPNARTVELSGDFTGWRPIAMQQVTPDVWQTTASLATGAHRVNVRVDGDGWAAPPGLPSQRDDFNGTVGLFVVR